LDYICNINTAKPGNICVSAKLTILHTADVHLRSVGDVRWQALEKLLDSAQMNRADVMVFAGDLFDSDFDGQSLRPRIRQLFERFHGKILIIPGNHDAKAYAEGVFLGNNVIVFRDLMIPEEIDGVAFWGFPYEEMNEEEILPFLKMAAEKVNPEKTNVLIFHGELYDAGGVWGEYGEEGRSRYLPVKLHYFQNLPWRYVLAGHFHRTFSVHEFAPKHYFVYPGSPVAITRREIGVRKVNLFKMGKTPQPLDLDTFYYHLVKVKLDPFSEQSPLEMIAAQMNDIPPNARVLLSVNGYINSKQLGMSETQLFEAIEKLLGEDGDIAEMSFRDIHDILENELFKRFCRHLDDAQLPEPERRELIDLTVKAMMEMVD
jgi:DNA repair exonuclease SbcCD nuclease subunit